MFCNKSLQPQQGPTLDLQCCRDMGCGWHCHRSHTNHKRSLYRLLGHFPSSLWQYWHWRGQWQFRWPLFQRPQSYSFYFHRLHPTTWCNLRFWIVRCEHFDGPPFSCGMSCRPDGPWSLDHAPHLWSTLLNAWLCVRPKIKYIKFKFQIFNFFKFNFRLEFNSRSKWRCLG